MVLDTSAVIALMLAEPAAECVLAALEADVDRRISAASVVECGIVLQSRLGDEGGRELDLLMHRAGIRIEPVTEQQADLAREAHRRFGIGRHSARLNYGDCFAYALAADIGQPVLHTCADFSQTDIESIRCPGA
jgi:ribonuclease VapC